MLWRNPNFARKAAWIGLLLLIVTLAVAPVRARRVYVKAGFSIPDSLFPSIQEGVNHAEPGDTVWVNAGTYYETVKFDSLHDGEEQNGTILYKYVVAAGPGPVLLKAQENWGFLMDKGAHFVWIEGMHITNGYGVSTGHGSGIRCFGDSCVFLFNNVYDNDVGIFCEGDSLDDETQNNRGNYIAHNVISDNGEAGVRLKHSSQNDVVFNLIWHNGYRIEPAGAVTFYCGIGNRIINNTFWNNKGPAIHAYNGTDAEECVAASGSDVRDNIFARPDGGALMRVDSITVGDGTSLFHYNLFFAPDSGLDVVLWGTNEWSSGGAQWTLSEFLDSAIIGYNPAYLTGNFFADPLFANVGLWNFELLPGSPAIDAGSLPATTTPFLYPPDSVLAADLTATGGSVKDGNLVDLGYHHPVDYYSTNSPITSLTPLAIFPNPNPGDGILHLVLPNVSYGRRITGQIYDLAGRLVYDFRVPDNPFNFFTLDWNAKGLASGLYFLVLNVNGEILRQRILLVK